MTGLSDEQIRFIDDFASQPFDKGYFNDVYGEDVVRDYLQNNDIIMAIKKRKAEIKREKAEAHTLYLSQLGMFKAKAMENIAGILADKNHKDHARISQWVMAGEFSYIAEKAKAEGARAGSESKAKRQPLRLVPYDDEG